MNNPNVLFDILERTEALVLVDRNRYDRLTQYMDLDNADKSVGMDFDRLLAADDFTFAHDIGGIMSHMDRETGELTDCFLPRCAKTEN